MTDAVWPVCAHRRRSSWHRRQSRPRRSCEVEDLRIEFLSGQQWLPVMYDARFSVERGKTLGLVGESGSGKTVTALAVMGLLPPTVSRVSGSIQFEQHELTSLSPSGMRRLRGNDIAMIFQEPMTSLNPAYTVGNQIAEQVRTHRGISRADAWKVAVEMLDRVEIPHAATRAQDYPHAFSGGMRQRVMIAMALSCSPKLLIADEPTTALDVTTQAQIVELLHELQRQEDMAMIFVTHDLGVIADVADDVVVMYAGQIVEQRVASDLFVRPAPPLHRGALAFDSPAHAAGRTAARHPRHGAPARPVPVRLSLCSPLLLRAGRLCGGSGLAACHRDGDARRCRGVPDLAGLAGPLRPPGRIDPVRPARRARRARGRPPQW